MFCDMVGSTALSARLDPEDMRDLITDYREICAASVKRFGGYVAQYLGDGVLVYFGYPHAYEHDVENSVRAARAIVERLSQEKRDELQVQIAIATGTVVVGDVVGENTHERDIAIGETPNLAARLIGLAGPGEIVVPESTWSLLTGLFDFVDMGEHALKGFAEPVRAWRVTGEPKANSLSHAVHNRDNRLPLIARESEIGRLEALWDQAARGSGQVVMIAGEAGIGKSHLARHFEDQLGAGETPPDVTKYYCSDNARSTTLGPVLDHLITRAQVEASDSPADKSAKIADYLARRIGATPPDADVVMDFLSIGGGGAPAEPTTSPEARKAHAFDLLEQLFCTCEPGRPALVIIEDLHWCDATTLELLERILIERVPGLRLLVILTARPEFLPNWPEGDHISTLIVERFTPDEAERFLAGITTGLALPKSLRQEIIERSDSIPLFLEEVCKATSENIADMSRTHGRGVSQSITAVNVPTSLAGSLMERLDRLGPVKQVAQVAAAIGQVFSGSTLANVGLLPDDELQPALDQLVQAEIILPRQKSADPTYVFKHALVQDAAYASMLRGERKDLHLKLAAILEDEQRGSRISQPELIALHCARGGLPAKAVGYWRIAGERARGRSANSDAIAHFGNALELLDALADAEALEEIEIELRTNLALALSAVHGGGSREVGENYTRARSLSSYNAGSAEHFPVMIGCWNNSFAAGQINDAMSLSEEVLRIADRKNDPSYAVEANRIRGMTQFYNGDFIGARESIRAVIDLHDREDHKKHALRFGLDPLVCCHAYLSYAYLFLGQREDALRSSNEAIAEAERIAHPYSNAFALAFAAFVRVNLELHEEALDLANRVIGYAIEGEFQFFERQQKVVKAWAEVQTGTAGVVNMRAAVDAFLGSSTNIGSTRIMSMMAEASLLDGAHDHARQMLDQARDAATQKGETFYLAEIHRLQAELTLAELGRDRLGAACDDLATALDFAEAQNAAIWIWRTARTVSRLHAVTLPASQLEMPDLAFEDFASDEAAIAARLTGSRALMGEMAQLTAGAL